MTVTASLNQYVEALLVADSWPDSTGNRDAIGAACLGRWTVDPPAEVPDGRSLAGEADTVLAPWAFDSIELNQQAFHDLMEGSAYAQVRELAIAGRSTGEELLEALNATSFGYTFPSELDALVDAAWAESVPTEHPNPPAAPAPDEWEPPAGARDVVAVRVASDGTVSVYLEPELESVIGPLIHTIDWQTLITEARQSVAAAATEAPAEPAADEPPAPAPADSDPAPDQEPGGTESASSTDS